MTKLRSSARLIEVDIEILSNDIKELKEEFNKLTKTSQKKFTKTNYYNFGIIKNNNKSFRF